MSDTSEKEACNGAAQLSDRFAQCDGRVEPGSFILPGGHQKGGVLSYSSSPMTARNCRSCRWSTMGNVSWVWTSSLPCRPKVELPLGGYER